MQIFTKLSVILSILFSICSVTLGHEHLGKRTHLRRHHDDLAVRAPGDMKVWKRFDNARFTYYAVGLGACGQTNQPSDFIVALNSDQYGGGQYCFQMITITVNGKTTQAQIMDECPGCPNEGLDFSEGLFTYFSDLSAGSFVWHMELWLRFFSLPPLLPPLNRRLLGKLRHPPRTVQAPTTTWTPPTTSTTPTSTSASTTATSTSTSASTVATSTTSNALAVESSAPSGAQVSTSSVLNDLDLSLLGFGGLLVACENQ
ncbi:RlpA-like double-psi beta-barrel-protein domain-containing protein-containing protein [Pisolithus croceorrhizus]|nr:RlpA-like double-psi beta-barrel-protein domain-containing protein-containing protein [Pisolithus croceorrhizus]